MLSEWSAECSADDPVLVVPWSDPTDSTGNRRFIDLRENPYDLDHLPEAEQFPPLMHALRALNAAALLDSRVEASAFGPPRRYYQITEDGRKALAEWLEAWRDMRCFVDTAIISEKA